MFYLIGGAPRAGKTTVAKQLSSDLGVPWISTDTLETIVSKYVSEDTFAQLFPKTVVRRETKQSNDLMYTEHSAQEIKDLYIKQAETLWHALKTFIECESRCGHDYILEGYHIPPELIIQLQDQYPMQSIFLGREDAIATLDAITKGSATDDWVINKTVDNNTFPKIAEMLALFGREVRTEAEKRGLRYLDMGTDLEVATREAVRYLKSTE